MSDNKKYYYLKLKENFFDSEEMKILESMKNGEKYQNLYLKLCLLALKGNGKLVFKDTIPYDPDMLSVVLRVDIDTVKTGCELFGKLGLLVINDIGHLYMSDIQSLVGHGSTEAERKKEYRAKINKSADKKELGHCPDKRPPELESEIEIENKDNTETSLPNNSSLRKEHTDILWGAWVQRTGRKPLFSPKHWKQFEKWEEIATLEDTQKLAIVIGMDITKEFNAKRIIENFPNPLLWVELINWIKTIKLEGQKSDRPTISKAERDMYNQAMQWGNDNDKKKWTDKFPEGIDKFQVV